MNQARAEAPAYRPMIEACREHGISRTVAYELINSGDLDTFKIGTRRYVYVESLRTLPERLKAKQGVA